jgi:hypothetical protein
VRRMPVETRFCHQHIPVDGVAETVRAEPYGL